MNRWKTWLVSRGPAFPAAFPGPITELALPLPATLAQTPENVVAESVILFAKSADSSSQPIAWLSSRGTPEFAFSVKDWLREMHQESYRKEHTLPLSARLPFHYHHIPGWLRNGIAAVLLKANGKKSSRAPTFPGTDYNPGVEWIAELNRPSKAEAPILLLTHDVDTFGGQQNIRAILELELSLGFRSSWNFVPQNYSLLSEILAFTSSSGGEIGLHGLTHNNRECFLPPGELRQRLEALQPFLHRYRIAGFRSPSWYRNKQLYEALEGLFTYDLSTLDCDRVCPGGHGGVGRWRPFRIRPRLWELPCTLPFEAPIFHGIAPAQLLEYWKPKIRAIHQMRGLLLVNTHPDDNYLGNPKLRSAYEELLNHLKTYSWTHQLPRDYVASLQEESI